MVVLISFVRKGNAPMRDKTHQAPSDPCGKGFFHAWRALLTILALIAVGCSAPAAVTPRPTVAPSLAPTVAPTLAPTAASVDFPITLTDDEGTQLTLSEEPDSIVSLTPATTELVFALGAGDRLKGGTDFDDFPPEAVGLPDVATFTGVLIEKVVDIDPDLVIAGGNNFTSAADIDRLRGLGLTVMVIYAPTVAAVLDDIQLVGDAIGASAEAQAMTAAMESRIDEVSGAVASLAKPRVFYEIGNEPEIFGPAPDSFVANMVELAGGDAVTTTDPAVFSIPLERLVSEDPEVIVLGDAAYGVCPDNVLSRPGWSSITAVRDGDVRPVDDIVVTRPGPRLGEGLAALALTIHPEAEIAAPTAGAQLCTSAPAASPSP
jgi:iron complex transport system substrate-binding protein